MTDATTEITELADQLLTLMMDAEPLEASLMGFRDRDARLADLSPESEATVAAEAAAIAEAARAIPPSALSPQDRLTREVVLTQADLIGESHRVESLDFTVAAFPVSPSSILLAYVRLVVVADAAQGAAYIERLSQVPRYLGQARERLHRGRVAGLTPVANLVQMAVAQIDRFLDAEPNPLAIEPAAMWDGVDEWRTARDAVIAEQVTPAFRAFREALIDEALPTARGLDEVGLVYLPDGSERYRRLVRVHTTTDRTPEDLHQTGLDLVSGIHDEFRALGARLFGIDDVRAIFDRLQNDLSLRWATSEQIVAAAETAVRRAEAASGDWFGRMPSAVCALEAIPEIEAEGAAPAYYMPPALDGSRPGTYFTNVNKPHERTSFDLESVAYHEAVPGHHFQISLALELEDLPMLRRMAMFTAYAEGWGLYAERLADEMGLYSSDLQRMGMLSADVWRAARLVVDTGLHAFGWSRQRAVDYLLENTPVAPIDVESEIDRYIAMPGQALSYMTGRLEIQRLRGRATEQLGDAFDIREFHDVVLCSGGLPLSVLGDVVEAWIQERAA